MCNKVIQLNATPSMHAPPKNTRCSSRKLRISCLDVKLISLDTAEHSRISRGTVALSSWWYMSLPLPGRRTVHAQHTHSTSTSARAHHKHITSTPVRPHYKRSVFARQVDGTCNIEVSHQTCNYYCMRKRSIAQLWFYFVSSIYTWPTFYC